MTKPTAPERAVMHPASGELVDLDAPTTDLAAGLEALDDLIDGLGDFRQVVVEEVTRRMDAYNSRTEHVGQYVLETNAPVTETYPLRQLRKALEGLVEANVLEAGVIDRVIKQPPPQPQDPKVDKRELNKLKGHGNPRVAAALGAVRERHPQRRTLKIKRAKGGPDDR